MKRLGTIILILMALSFGSRASLYRTYQTDDGLSHNSVWAVMQDSRGFIWLGTNDGLNRFDGLNFKVYRRVESDTLSLGSNFIHCLQETKDGKILVGTKEGLYSFDSSTEKFHHIKLDGKPFGMDKTSIHCLVPDSKGEIWVGCYGQGIYRLSPDLKVIGHYAGENTPVRFVTAMTIDADGSLWVGTDNAGLFCLDPSTRKVKHSSLDKENVQTIFRQNNNTLWVGTAAKGLYHYDPRGDVAAPITVGNAASPIKDIKAITPYNTGEVIMSSDHGLLKLDYNKESLSYLDAGYSFDNLPDNSIFAIAVDKEGGLWLGTYFYGACYRSPRINAFSFFSVDNSNAGSAHYSILHQLASTGDGNVVITSRKNGISVFNPNTSAIQNFNTGASTDNVNAIFSNGNELWISNYGQGISVLSYPGGGVSRSYTTADGLPSNIVNVFYRTANGNIYAGTQRGAACYNGTAFEEIPALKGAPIMGILEDFKGNIWFSTHFHGLYKLGSNGKVENYKNVPKDLSSIPGNNINNIFLDTKGKIWIGTEGEGLAIFNPNTGKVEKRISEANGLPSNIVYATQEDELGNMWITTGGGLIKISGDKYEIQNFRYLENLLKIHYTHNSSLNTKGDGKLYFGGSGGFISFNPKDISKNPHKPAVFVTSCNIDGRDLILSADHPGIVVEASESTLGIDVACLSYLSPEQNVIAYRLTGYDDDWKYLTTRERHIEYMNLPWGDYKLEVKGANNDGIWSDPSIVDVTVNRPLLLSNGMLLVYLILLVFAGYLVKLRINTVQRRRMVKFSHAKEKELYEAKIGFFTNIAHEIRTPLSLISAPLESILSSNDGTEKTRHNLKVMKSNVQRLLELINQLLDFRKVEAQLMRLNFRKCNASELTTDICNRYEDFANLHLIKLDTKDIENDVECVMDADAFQKMVGNLMSNAMKYADKHIKVAMYVDEARKMLHLEVTDDGPGIKDKDIDKIFESFYRVDDHGKHPGTGLGLPLARNLAEMHSGTLTVSSQYGHGSKFILEIPTTLEEGEEALVGENGEAVNAENKVEMTDSRESEKPAILIVEDNEQLREFVSENLNDTYTVYTASNGVEAIKQLETTIVDLIVSDIMMPDMDGIELCRVLRSTPEFSHIPVIMLSAKTDVETKIEGLNIGADAYIEKPFSIEQLKAQIKSILDNRKRYQESLIKSPLDYYKKHKTDDGKDAEKAEFINKLNSLILENLTNPDFSIDGIAQEFCMSRSSFHKRIKGITGETPNDYIRIVRLSKSAELLASGKYQIVEVCYMVGFNTPSYFSKCFAKHFGKLPKEYINDLNNNNNNEL